MCMYWLWLIRRRCQLPIAQIIASMERPCIQFIYDIVSACTGCNGIRYSTLNMCCDEVHSGLTDREGASERWPEGGGTVCNVDRASVFCTHVENSV
jgi:hypothetical protein